MATKKRDAKYYRRRLEKEFPKIHDDLVAGRFPSVRQAAAAAGLIHLPTRVDALKREWKRAGTAERLEFVKWLKAAGPTKAPRSLPIVDHDNRLRSDVAKFLADWVRTHRARPGRIMKEMGFKVFDWTLAHAIGYGAPLRQEVVDKLGPWLIKSGYRP
jgi:hypothetical protein